MHLFQYLFILVPNFPLQVPIFGAPGWIGAIVGMDNSEKLGLGVKFALGNMPMLGKLLTLDKNEDMVGLTKQNFSGKIAVSRGRLGYERV